MFFGKIRRKLATKKRRKGLKNYTFSIISNTCIGGVISNSLGEQFRSPTVNLVIYEDKFPLFCRHLKEYSICEVDEPKDSEKAQFAGIGYPVGILRGAKAGLPDINLMFVHYNSFDEAKKKWHERFKRVNYDDLFFIMDRGMDATESVLDDFYSIPYEHKVFFTDVPQNEKWKNNFAFSYYTPEKYESGCLYKVIRKGIYDYRWLDEFDYVRWLNTGEIGKTDIVL